MDKIRLGNQGLNVSKLGLGCMGMSDFYGAGQVSDAEGTLHKALDLGVNFWDTSDMYGPYTNERLLGEHIRKHGIRDRIVLASKFGIMRNEQGETLGINGRPEYVQQVCEASLQRLGVECIDLYYQHRVDPEVPIEETVGAMAELVKQGKVKYLGLSEASLITLERACQVFPISAIQSEYSLWSRDLEYSLIPSLERLGVGLVAYSPLGRGFLTGGIRSRSDLKPGDWRLQSPRFSEENFQQNLALVEKVEELAAIKSCTPAQLALTWVMAKGHVPIPGCRSVGRITENAAAFDVQLSAVEVMQIDLYFSQLKAQGTRYPEAVMSSLER